MLISIHVLKKLFPYFSLTFLYVCLLSYLPTIHTIVSGQITLFINLLVILGIYLIKKNRYLVVGILWSLLSIKLHFLTIPIFLFAVFKKNLKLVASFAIGIITLFLISIQIVGRECLSSYPDFVIKTEDNINMQISWVRHFGKYILTNYFSYNGFGAFMYFWIVFMGVLAVVFYFVSRHSSLYKRISLFLMLAVSTLPHSWEYDLLLLIFPILTLITIFGEKNSFELKIRSLSISFLIYFSWVWRFLSMPFMSSLSIFFLAIYWLIEPRIDTKNALRKRERVFRSPKDF
jgi:hypothetical protein